MTDTPTFAIRPSFLGIDRSDPAAAICVAGIPYDLGTSNRPGARFGPRAVRVANYQPPTWHLDLQIAPFEVLKVIDYGDAACYPGLSDPAHAAIRARVAEVASRKIVPIVIGGDHSITYPSATAVADAYGRGKVGMVHFDAHADTGTIQFGSLVGHGLPMRRLIESGAIPGRNFVQIGLRGYWPDRETFEWMRSQGMRWHLMGELLDLLGRLHADRRSAERRNEIADGRRGETDAQAFHVLDGADRHLGRVDIAGLVREQQQHLDALVFGIEVFRAQLGVVEHLGANLGAADEIRQLDDLGQREAAGR